MAKQLIVSTVLWSACIFAWVSLLTFDPADPPAAAIWPQNTHVHNVCGSAGAHLAFVQLYYLGAGAYPTLLMITAVVAACSYNLRLSEPWMRFLGTALVCTAVSTAASMFVSPSEKWLISGPGGVLGTASAHFLMGELQTAGAMLVVFCVFCVGMILAANEVVAVTVRWALGIGKQAGPAVIRGGGQVLAGVSAGIVDRMAGMSNRLATAGADARTARSSAKPARPPKQLDLELPEEAEEETAEAVYEEADGEEIDAAEDTPEDEAEAEYEEEEAPVVEEEIEEEGPVVTKLDRKPQTPPLGGAVMPESQIDSGDYELPPIELLGESDPVDKGSIEIICREKAYILEQTLNEFRLEVRVVSIETGPVITVFELKLAPGIKVSQIVSLSNDMARALKAPSVRVVAPLPGKNTIGIEVPNVDKEKVRIKDLMLHAPQRVRSHVIPLYLGKDASGAPLVTDLTKMPHLLIAGTTGSGKSVCISSIISSVLMTKTPEEVNMILVDPKVVELSIFKDIPHLMCPIVTEVSKAEGILDWAATKMDERYALLAEAGVKDIRSYNKLGVDELKERMELEDEELARIPVKMPYIVIVIDELADLMMTSAKEVEFYLCRLAQKSRAVGIHLIVSTQRPQANVVTGLIKSNLPCRIAFRVSSRLDSRIVLDQNGGETLMGQGDMLFLPPGSAKLLRAQGTFIPDDELRDVVKHVRTQGKPNFNSELMKMPKANGEGSGERDELFDQAVDIIIQSGRGSVSLLQRRLTIGYSRASRLIDQMYEAGIVGEYKGSQAREVVLSKEDWDAVRKARDREEAQEDFDL